MAKSQQRDVTRITDTGLQVIPLGVAVKTYEAEMSDGTPFEIFSTTFTVIAEEASMACGLLAQTLGEKFDEGNMLLEKLFLKPQGSSLVFLDTRGGGSLMNTIYLNIKSAFIMYEPSDFYPFISLYSAFAPRISLRTFCALMELA